MRTARLMQELAHLIDNKREIRTCKGEVLKTTNQTAISGSFIRRENITVSTAKTLRSCHGSMSWTTLEHTGTSKKIKSILALPKKESSRSARINLNAQKVVYKSKVFNRELRP
jgi:hypothetical protein